MSTRFAICTFRDADGARRTGLVIDDRVWDLGQLVAASDNQANKIADVGTLELLDDWDRSLPILQDLADGAGQSGVAGRGMAELDIRAPIENPRQIFCTGANYRKHVVDLTVDMGVGPDGLDDEGLRKWATDMMEARARDGDPYAFTKPVTAVAGPNDSLVVPDTTSKLDWEIELAVVIGREGYNIPLEQTHDYIAGYALVNDISARDLIARTDYQMLGTDWLRAKGQPGFLPFGPVIVPSRFISDPEDLYMRLEVNGQVMQNESTSDMLFGIARQIEYISRYAKLLPGDLICTGSPAGNGTHYNRYLQPGDLMTAEIEGLGRQTVHCIAPS